MNKILLLYTKINFYYRRYGFFLFIKKVYQYYNIHLFFNNVILGILKFSSSKKKLELLVEKHKQTPIFIYPSFHSWNMPLFQRPQHLALALSNYYLYLFITNNKFDHLNSIKQVSNKCFILPPILAKQAYTLQRKIILLYSTPSKLFPLEQINKHLSEGNIIIYDYLDELNEEIFGIVDEEAIKRHEAILADERIICLASANKLYEHARQFRINNLYLVENGVNPKHYTKVKQPIPRLEKLKKKKIIGYFGALSAWVDYPLLIKLAQQNPDKYIVLIGCVYDNQIEKYNLLKYENIILWGVVPYMELPNYAHYFDVSIIPFLINETTLSTSPLKLFEYMALGKPIVTTDLPECKKYQSSMIAKNHEEFIALVNQALAINSDSDYFRILAQEAQQNSWEARAQVIQQAILQNLGKIEPE
jgi:teichuronic acid biosynthesis glycosyltransferase TuaH